MLHNLILALLASGFTYSSERVIFGTDGDIG